MSNKTRLDHELAKRGLVTSRSQAETYIKLGKVFVDGKQIIKPGFFIAPTAGVVVKQTDQYVSRAGLKLASVVQLLGLDFTSKIVLDVGSSTGGFTDYTLRNGAKKVFAIDVGTNQLHPTLRANEHIELHEQTNILDVRCSMLDIGYKSKIQQPTSIIYLSAVPDIIVIDVSFVSLRQLLPHISQYLSGQGTQIVAMFKPQFEVGADSKVKGIIKNDSVRRQVLKDFEAWVKKYYVITSKADSEVSGAKGNRERFYLLHIL